MNYERLAGSPKYRDVRVKARVGRVRERQAAADADRASRKDAREQKRQERAKDMEQQTHARRYAREQRKKLTKLSRIGAMLARRVEKRRAHAAELAGKRAARLLPPLPY